MPFYDSFVGGPSRVADIFQEGARVPPSPSLVGTTGTTLYVKENHKIVHSWNL